MRLTSQQYALRQGRASGEWARALAVAGRLPGAVFAGGRWRIPADSRPLPPARAELPGLSVKIAALNLGLTPAAVHWKAQRGKILGAVRIGCHWRIPADWRPVRVGAKRGRKPRPVFSNSESGAVNLTRDTLDARSVFGHHGR